MAMLGGLTGLLVSESRAAGDGAEIVWNSRDEYPAATAPHAFDVDLDGEPEVFVSSGNAGRYALLDPATGKPHWQGGAQLKSQLIGAAVSGWFLSDGGLDLALMAGDGTLLLIDGRSGRVLTQYLTDTPPSGAPAAVPLGNWTEGSPAPETAQDGLAVIDKQGRLTVYRFSEDRTPSIHLRRRLRGFSENPPAVALTRAPLPPPHLVTLSENGWLSLASLADANAPSVDLKIDGIFLRTSLAIGDVDADGYDELLISGDRGWLRALQPRESQGQIEMAEAWPRISVRSEPSTAPVAADFNGDGHDDILVVKDNRFIAINGATGAMDLWPARSSGTLPEYLHDVAVASPPALVHDASGRAYALFGDIAGRYNLLDLVEGSLRNGGALMQTAPAGERTTRASAVAGPISENGVIGFIAMTSRDGTAIKGEFAVNAARDGLLWLGGGGTPWRTNQLSPRFERFRQMRAAAINEVAGRHLASARAHFNSGQWDESIAEATAALELNPGASDARQVIADATSRKNLPVTILKFLLVFALLGTGGWLGWRYWQKQARIRRARAAKESGDYDLAIRLTREAADAEPNRAQYQTELADLYIAAHRLDEKSVPALERARKLNPDNRAYLEALAAAYAAAGRKDEDAARVYTAMAGSSKERGPWLYQLARTHHERGHQAEAVNCLHEAIGAGFNPPELQDLLAEVYVRLEMHGAEVLPVMRTALSRHLKDAEFLKAYCRSTLAAGQFDANAIQAAEALDELGAATSEAKIILATAACEAGDLATARRHAETVLADHPDQSDALKVLARCLASEQAGDPASQEVYRKALAVQPESPEIVTALARAWAAEERNDADAEAIYRRALNEAPDDEAILRQLAKIAEKRDDHALALRVLKPLWTAGVRDTDTTLQYARALATRGLAEPPAEEVLLEALDLEPGDRAFSVALAEIYAANGRTDDEAAGVYEEASRPEGAPSPAIARQLLKIYEKEDKPERALEFAEAAVKKFPEDPVLNQCVARARMKLGQTEEAMAAFEQVFAAHPDDREAVLGLAMMYLETQRTDDRALDVYKRAIEFDPQNIELYAALGRCWIARNRWDEVVATVKHFLAGAPKRLTEAVNLMHELVEKKPEALDLHWFLVDTSIYAGHLQRALKQIEQILSIDSAQSERALEKMDSILDRHPEEPVVHHYRGRLLLKMGRIREGRNSLEQAMRLNPSSESLARDLLGLYQKISETSDSPELKYQMGNAALKAKNYDLAISCFQQSERDPRFEVESIQNLGRCFIAKGMLDLALKELTRVPLDKKSKEALYSLGQRYEAERNSRGAREAYKVIYAADISFKDVKTRLDALEKAADDEDNAERRAIAEALSEKAKLRYQLLAELGRGAMGIVYKAKDNELDEVVALKILPDTLEKNENALRLFRQEARNARKLAHRNIVRIHDIGEEQGRKYISMEYVEGIDLKRRLKQLQGRVPLREALHYAKQIARAMMAAHEVGIVHRDLKPANIMITRRGRVKVTDFGIAKMMEDEANMYRTRPGAVVGTPLYMSPEQVRGQNVDSRADVYSFGVMLYEMLSGRPPFVEGNLARHHLYTDPAPLDEDVPESLRSLVMKCLAKDVDARWQGFKEILKELSVIDVSESGDAEEGESDAAEERVSSN